MEVEICHSVLIWCPCRLLSMCWILMRSVSIHILELLGRLTSDGLCQQISFQEFKNKLLEPGLVDRIEVANKILAKVYVRAGELEYESHLQMTWLLLILFLCWLIWQQGFYFISHYLTIVCWFLLVFCNFSSVYWRNFIAWFNSAVTHVNFACSTTHAIKKRRR